MPAEQDQLVAEVDLERGAPPQRDLAKPAHLRPRDRPRAPAGVQHQAVVVGPQDRPAQEVAGGEQAQQEAAGGQQEGARVVGRPRGRDSGREASCGLRHDGGGPHLPPRGRGRHPASLAWGEDYDAFDKV